MIEGELEVTVSGETDERATGCVAVISSDALDSMRTIAQSAPSGRTREVAVLDGKPLHPQIELLRQFDTVIRKYLAPGTDPP